MPSRLASRSLREPEGKSRARARARGIEESFQTATSSRGVSLLISYLLGAVRIAAPNFLLLQETKWHPRKHSKMHHGDGDVRRDRKIARVASALKVGSLSRDSIRCRQADQREPNASPPGREIGHQGHGHRVQNSGARPTHDLEAG